MKPLRRHVVPNSLANTISHMAEGWYAPTFLEHRFLGFLPTADGYRWGVELDGEDHVAVHVFRTAPGFHWGDDPADTAGLAQSKPWVLMFYGSDNSSYFRRFSDETKITKFWEARLDVDPIRDKLMFYNS